MQPIESSTNAVKSMPTDSLSAAATDIGSVMIDTIPDPHGANYGSVTSASEKSMPAIERLIKAVKSMSPSALSSAADNFSSAIRTTDRFPESPPVNGTTVVAHCGFPTTASRESSVTKQSIERLIKAVKSMSPNAFSAAADDFSSAIRMFDRVPESPPVNGTTVGPHCGFPTTASRKSSVTEQPIERLIRAMKSMSPNALSAAVNDIRSVMVDQIAESGPVNVTEDLAAMTNCCLQAKNFISQDEIAGTRKRNRYTSAMPEKFDMATATSNVKRPRIMANHALLEEIREINQKLIDTVVDISNEDIDRTAAATVSDEGEGTVVKCSFSPVTLSPSLKSQYDSAQMSRIQPLKLLLPSGYPNSSPVWLENFFPEVSKEYEDVSEKTKSSS